MPEDFTGSEGFPGFHVNGRSDPIEETKTQPPSAQGESDSRQLTLRAECDGLLPNHNDGIKQSFSNSNSTLEAKAAHLKKVHEDPIIFVTHHVKYIDRRWSEPITFKVDPSDIQLIRARRRMKRMHSDDTINSSSFGNSEEAQCQIDGLKCTTTAPQPKRRKTNDQGRDPFVFANNIHCQPTAAAAGQPFLAGPCVPIGAQVRNDGFPEVSKSTRPCLRSMSLPNAPIPPPTFTPEQPYSQTVIAPLQALPVQYQNAHRHPLQYASQLQHFHRPPQPPLAQPPLLQQHQHYNYQPQQHDPHLHLHLQQQNLQQAARHQHLQFFPSGPHQTHQIPHIQHQQHHQQHPHQNLHPGNHQNFSHHPHPHLHPPHPLNQIKLPDLPRRDREYINGLYSRIPSFDPVVWEEKATGTWDGEVRGNGPPVCEVGVGGTVGMQEQQQQQQQQPGFEGLRMKTGM